MERVDDLRAVDLINPSYKILLKSRPLQDAERLKLLTQERVRQRETAHGAKLISAVLSRHLPAAKLGACPPTYQ